MNVLKSLRLSMVSTIAFRPAFSPVSIRKSSAQSCARTVVFDTNQTRRKQAILLSRLPATWFQTGRRILPYGIDSPYRARRHIPSFAVDCRKSRYKPRTTLDLQAQRTRRIFGNCKLKNSCLVAWLSCTAFLNCSLALFIRARVSSSCR